jgi:hypothetical protein
MRNLKQGLFGSRSMMQQRGGSLGNGNAPEKTLSLKLRRVAAI